jgi:hypothetical protein
MTNKTITPMTRLSGSRKVFKDFVNKYYHEQALNKVVPKYNPLDYSYSNGVESDCVMIFNARKQNHISFAFIFNYLNKTEPTVTISLKGSELENGIVYSNDMSVEEFRVKLNKINKNFKGNELTELFILEQITSVFLESNNSLKDEMQLANESLANFIKDQTKSLKINELETVANLTKKTFVKVEKNYEIEIAKSMTKRKIEDLQNELKLLNNIYKQEQEELKKILLVDKLYKDKSIAEDSLAQAKKELNYIIESEINNLQSNVVKKINLKRLT